jgi:hypothetical protein
MTEERRDHEDMPEHERRPETGVGGGLTGQGGTAPEAEPGNGDRRTDPNEAVRQPTSDATDGDADEPEPEDPDGPEVAYQPRSI